VVLSIAERNKAAQWLFRSLGLRVMMQWGLMMQWGQAFDFAILNSTVRGAHDGVKPGA
jgi:hypothetical protein